MRRCPSIVLSLVLTAFIVTPGTAQQGFFLGPQAGGSLGNIAGTLLLDGEWRWGGFVGVFGEYQFSPNVSVELDVNWVQKGLNNAIFSPDFVGATPTQAIASLQLAYVEVPILVNLMFPTATGDQAGMFRLFAGFGVAANTQCNIIDALSGAKESCTDAGLDNETTELSVPLGIGYGFVLGGSRLILDVRYILGLTDLLKDNPSLTIPTATGGATTTLSQKTRTWVFMARYGFGLGN